MTDTSNVKVKIGHEGEETLQEIIARFNEIASNWNGEDPEGEHRAMAAQDIVDTAENLKGQIENYNF